MKDLGETLSLSKGAPVSNGVAVSRSSSSSSVDLHFHLTEDSDDETDDRNDSESVHDPKTSKLSAAGANFINMYKDSSEKCLEIVNSHRNELDNSIVESTACSEPNSVKMDEECERVGSNNSHAKQADDSEKNLESGETCMQVTTYIKESVENNTIADVLQPVAEEPVTTKCNSSLLRSKEDTSLTNGDVKAVTEISSSGAKSISIDTSLAVPSKIHIAKKDSANLDEKTNLISNSALCSSIGSNNVGDQIVSEKLCTSNTSGEDSKVKKEVQSTALDKVLEKECNTKQGLQRTALDQELEEDCKDKEKLQGATLYKEPKEDCKDNEEEQRCAVDKELKKDCKNQEEVKTTVLDKELEGNNYKKVAPIPVLDKRTEEGCKNHSKVQTAALGKALEKYSTDKKEIQTPDLHKELEDCTDKEEMQMTALDKELEDCTDEEMPTIALDKELVEDSMDKELVEDSVDKEEKLTVALDKDIAEDCVDKEEKLTLALDNELAEDCGDKEGKLTVALDKDIAEDCVDKEEKLTLALDNELAEDCGDNEGKLTVALDKDIAEDCVDKEEKLTLAVDKELAEDCGDTEEKVTVALDKELAEECGDKEEKVTLTLDKELAEDCGDTEEKLTVAVDKELAEDCLDKEDMQTPTLDKECEEDSKVDEEVHKTVLDETTEKAEEQSKDICDNIFPKDKSRDDGSLAPLEKSEHSVMSTSAHSDVSEDECDAGAKSNVATSNSSVETEHVIKKVENIGEKLDDPILPCASVIENDSSSTEGDDAVAHVAKVEESNHSATGKSCDAVDDTSTNNNNISSSELKVTSNSTIIDLCDSADEPGDINVCSEGLQSDLAIDLDEDRGSTPKLEIKEDSYEIQNTTKIPIEQKVEKCANSEDNSMDMERDEKLVKDDVPEINEVEPSSPATDESKGDSTFDMLLKDEINKTSESECTKEVGKARQSQADVSKENDVSAAGIQGSRVSSARDISSGFTVLAHKRASSIDDPIESKKAKLTNGHDSEVVADSKTDADNIDPTSEKTSVKRTSEFPDGLEPKKARVLSVDESSSNSCASSMSNEHVAKKCDQAMATDEPAAIAAVPRKPRSNIDKAIERVAFAGLDRKERVMMPFIKDLKNRRLQDITIDDLEELITQRMGEVLSETGENGVLREKVQKLEKMTEFWKNKATSLQKQLSDMTMVFKKLATETKQNSNQMQIPIKITRSVGLQVIMPSLQSVGKNNTTHMRNGLPPGTKRKSGGIMTNRNTTPTIHYPQASTAVSPNRTPVVQKVVTPSPAKLPQAVPSPKPPVTSAPPPAIRFRAPSTTVTSVVSTRTVMTVAGNLSTAASAPGRPVVKSVTPRPTSDMLIDLTDEDDKTKRVSQPLRVAQINGSPPTLGSTIRFGPPQQLTGITTGVNGQRLAYMLPASAGSPTSGRLQLFTQQTSGNLRPSGMLTVRPSTQTQTLMLKNGAVVSSATPPSNMIRAGGTSTFQQVVARRTIQPAGRPTVVSLPPLHTQHPAPLPPPPTEFPSNPGWKKPPPRPDLKISKVDNREQHGIILSWNMDHGTEHEEIASYQLYAYQENNSPPSTSQWKKVGDVKAMPLPMACTLTQFLEGNKYHFAVRAIDIHSRSGLFSIPGHIILPRRGS